MSKAFLSRMRPHRTMALILCTLVVLSSVLMIPSIYDLPGQPCSFNSVPFQDATARSNNSFQITPPAKATICLTVLITGRFSSEGRSLVPGLGIYSTSPRGSSYSDCTNPGTNCGGVAVTASPSHVFFPALSIRVLLTINSPAGSTVGNYWLLYWPCQGGAMLFLKIGNLNQTSQNPPAPGFLCPFLTFHVSVTFNRYTGMVPIHQNTSIPVFL